MRKFQSEVREVHLEIQNSEPVKHLEFSRRDQIAFLTFVIHMVFGIILIVSLGYHILHDEKAVKLNISKKFLNNQLFHK